MDGYCGGVPESLVATVTGACHWEGNWWLQEGAACTGQVDHGCSMVILQPWSG